MSTIKDGAYKFWQSRQPNLLPLDKMREVEQSLTERQAKSILVVGMDLTTIAVLAYAKGAEAKVRVVLPRNVALISELRRISKQLGLDCSGVVEATVSQRAWPIKLPDVVREDTYDHVLLMGYAQAKPDHRRAVVDQIAGLLCDNSVVFIHPCGDEEGGQLLEDFSSHTQQFDVRHDGALADRYHRIEAVCCAVRKCA